jgi:uncharacterized protein
MKKRLITLSVLAFVAGCASTQKNSSNNLESNLQQGNTTEAINLAIKNADLDVEKNVLGDQLWGMQSASLFRMYKQYDKSNAYFDLVEDVMYQEDTESLLKEGGELVFSTFTNDTFLAYEQSLYDSIMVNTYKALNFTVQGDIANARVEWNRADDRQRRAADYFADKIKEKKEELAKEVAEKQKETGQADNASSQKSLSETENILAKQGVDMSDWGSYENYVNPFSTYMHGLFFMLAAQDKSDLNKAIDSFTRVNGITKTAAANESLNIAKNLLKNNSATDDKVWVVFENGRAIQKEEMRIDLPVFLVSNNIAYTGMALPKLKEQKDYFPSLTANGVNTEIIADMDKIIKAEFKEEFPLILSREITRTIAKTVVQKQLNDNNPLLGLGAGLLQAASTSADLRTWSMLPKNFQAAVIDKPNNNQVVLELNSSAPPMTVDINPEKKSIIYVKAVNPSVTPTIEVITL